MCVCVGVCTCVCVRARANTSHHPSLSYIGGAGELCSVLGKVCVSLAGSGALQSSGGVSLIFHTGTGVCMASCSPSKLASSSRFVGRGGRINMHASAHTHTYTHLGLLVVRSLPFYAVVHTLLLHLAARELTVDVVVMELVVAGCGGDERALAGFRAKRFPHRELLSWALTNALPVFAHHVNALHSLQLLGCGHRSSALFAWKRPRTWIRDALVSGRFHTIFS